MNKEWYPREIDAEGKIHIYHYTDPAEVERLVDELIRKAIRYGQSNHTNISNHNSTQVDQARSELLKLVGGIL